MCKIKDSYVDQIPEPVTTIPVTTIITSECTLPPRYSELELLKEENDKLLEELYKMQYKVDMLEEQLRSRALEEDDWK